MSQIVVGNIQEFSLDDGDGIRTTVFLKGCNLRCPWCCNPENIYMTLIRDVYSKKERVYSEQELLNILLKNEVYWGEKGGVTFSGGEPFLQLNSCLWLLQNLKANMVNINAETSLYFENTLFESVIPFFDRLYVDFKILDSSRAKKILQGDYDLFKKNLEIISNNNIDFIVRIPIVENITDSEANIREAVTLINRYCPMSIELFSVHNFATEKYARLGLQYNLFNIVENDRLLEIKNFIQSETNVSVIILSV